MYSICRYLITAIAAAVALPFCYGADYSSLKRHLDDYVKEKDARIGVAVVINGTDTVSVNGNRDFPMMSVFKFPQALAVAHYCDSTGTSYSDSVDIRKSEIKINTYSPLRDKYGVTDLRLPISELLAYSVQLSDNNACDILFRMIGGPRVADSHIKSMGFRDITIEATEDDMHRDLYLCYLNRSTPLAMARLFDYFHSVLRDSSDNYASIAVMLETCKTGLDRLAAPIADSETVIGHKTGTGDKNSQNRIIGVNDAGYVVLPDGNHYSIAVFVADSAYELDATSKIISDISEIVYDTLFHKQGSCCLTGRYNSYHHSGEKTD